MGLGSEDDKPAIYLQFGAIILMLIMLVVVEFKERKKMRKRTEKIMNFGIR